MIKLSRKQRETIASLIGEGVHTGLRKVCDSLESASTWRSITELPDGDWGRAVAFATDEVILYIESGEDER